MDSQGEDRDQRVKRDKQEGRWRRLQKGELEGA